LAMWEELTPAFNSPGEGGGGGGANCTKGCHMIEKTSDAAAWLYEGKKKEKGKKSQPVPGRGKKKGKGPWLGRRPGPKSR